MDSKTVLIICNMLMEAGFVEAAAHILKLYKMEDKK
jgi:hypothetical protein